MQGCEMINFDAIETTHLKLEFFLSSIKKTSKEIGDGGCYDNTKYIKYKTLDILSPDVHHSVVDVNITAKCLMFRPLNCHNKQASLKLQLHGCKVKSTA